MLELHLPCHRERFTSQSGVMKSAPGNFNWPSVFLPLFGRFLQKALSFGQLNPVPFEEESCLSNLNTWDQETQIYPRTVRTCGFDVSKWSTVINPPPKKIVILQKPIQLFLAPPNPYHSTHSWCSLGLFGVDQLAVQGDFEVASGPWIFHLLYIHTWPSARQGLGTGALGDVSLYLGNSDF